MTITHSSTRAIKASKMFRSGTGERQKKVLAELDKPENIELVTQLDEYLDTEYQIMNEPTADTTVEDVVEVQETDDIADDSPAPSGPSGPGAKFTPNESLMDKHGEELEELENGEPGEEPAEGEEEPPVPEASVKAKGKAITADTLVNPFVDYYPTLTGLAGEVKGTLNARSETAGVNRVQLKNDELWIYYNDDVNLNNIMSNAIGLLAAANYYYLEFNRLARSDNAMVFTLSHENTEGGIAGAGVKTDEK